MQYVDNHNRFYVYGASISRCGGVNVNKLARFNPVSGKWEDPNSFFITGTIN
jgi:hypothetical protein